RALLERNPAVGPRRAAIRGPADALNVLRTQDESLTVVPRAQTVLPEKRDALLRLAGAGVVGGLVVGLDVGRCAQGTVGTERGRDVSAGRRTRVIRIDRGGLEASAAFRVPRALELLLDLALALAELLAQQRHARIADCGVVAQVDRIVRVLRGGGNGQRQDAEGRARRRKSDEGRDEACSPDGHAVTPNLPWVVEAASGREEIGRRRMLGPAPL